MGADGKREEFTTFVLDVEPRLRRALVATYGAEDGRDAAAAALAWAWEHWDRVPGLRSPVAFLYRVGQSSRRSRREPPMEPDRGRPELPLVEPALHPALLDLSESQRVCVLLVHGFEWRIVEVAEVLGISTSTVRNHLARGMASLRQTLEVQADV